MPDNKKVCVFTIHSTKDLRVLNRQCRSLQRNGWKVTLIAIANKKLNKDALVGVYDDGGIKVIGVNKWHNLWGRIKTLFKITNLAFKENSDVYHFHDPDLLFPAFLLKLKTRKPFIYDIHEHFDVVFPYKLPDIWPLRQIIGKLILSIEAWFGAKFRNISVVYKEHIQRFEKRGCKVVHTPNYAAITDFVPEPISDKEWQERHNNVIFIGSLAPERGALLLPEIAKMVRHKNPKVKFFVTRRFHNNIQEQSFIDVLKKPEYENVIDFIPNVSGSELPKVVRKASIALSVDQPTRIGLTSQPTKTFEYMSQGLAIVASRLPNTIEHIESIGCGVLVDPGDPQQYADEIIKLIDNTDKLKKMGSTGQKAFKETYNWGVAEKRLIEFYNNLIKD